MTMIATLLGVGIIVLLFAANVRSINTKVLVAAYTACARCRRAFQGREEQLLWWITVYCDTEVIRTLASSSLPLTKCRENGRCHERLR